MGILVNDKIDVRPSGSDGPLGPILGVPLRTLSGLKLDALNQSYGANILVRQKPIRCFFILSVRKNRLSHIPTIKLIPAVIICTSLDGIGFASSFLRERRKYV